MLGEDYGGGTSDWSTVGWCTNRDDARQIARAFTAHRGHHARADVIEHGTDNGVVSMTTDTYLTAPDAPAPPRPPALGEEAWHPRRGPSPGLPGPVRDPRARLVPGSEAPAELVADRVDRLRLAHAGAHLLAVGEHRGRARHRAGGPYEWAEAWGPRHPDRDMHDWTQEGRELTHRFPETTYQERTQLFDAARRAREDALVSALAGRGGMGREQAAARLAEGGEKYRQVLEVGQAVISRALHTARRALPEGPGAHGHAAGPGRSHVPPRAAR